MWLSKTSKQDHRRLQMTARSETAPLLNKTNICRFSSARLKLMTSRECADRENGIGLCTRGPVRPDICFVKWGGWNIILYGMCAYVCVSLFYMCTCMHACVHVEATDARICRFPLQYIYSSMFISGWINMWMKGSVFLLCRSLELS